MKFIRALIFYIIFINFLPASAQTTKLNGLYAGCHFSPSPVFGGGMSRTDLIVLFRPDGTFTDQLGQGWKTNISGRYTISGTTITLNYAKGHTVYKLINDKCIFGFDTSLYKLQGNTIPAGYYSFISAMGGGGGAMGTPYVGATNRQGLTFDGKGNFSMGSTSTTAIAGSNVGGGSTRSSSGSGTYKINQGQLTLTFADGHTEEHSFFCDLGKGTRTAAVDGRIFFADDNDKPATVASTNKAGSTANAAAPTDGKSLLLRANNTHGGDKLNNIKTICFNATVQGVKAIELIDLVNSRVRLELWQGDKLISVDQTEGNAGWHWASGSKTALTADKAASISSSLYGNILGLRKATLDKMQIVKTEQISNNNGYTITCTLNGNNYVYAVNGQNQLIAFGYQVSKQTSFSILSDLRTVQGIVIPFHEKTKTEQQKLDLQYDALEINPQLNDQRWAVPVGS